MTVNPKNKDRVISKRRFRFSPFYKSSLRIQVAVGIALPIFIIMILFSISHYYDEWHAVEENIIISTKQIAGIMNSSLQYAMLTNDKEMMGKIISDIGSEENVLGVQLINLEGEVKASDNSHDLGKKWGFSDPVCWECHQLPPESRPSVIKRNDSVGVLRVVTPIVNKPDCMVCHEEEGNHLGVLLLDVSLTNIEAHILNKITIDMFISLSVALLVALGAYYLIHRLVVRRVEAIRSPLTALTAGDFSIRVPSSATETDELGELANAFNQMAGELEHHKRELEQRTQVRERAIVEERERIARELHDGLSQLLGYINIKTSAVRLQLQNRHLRTAEIQLQQLEEAAQGLSLDVREAILGLTMSGRVGDNLATLINECTQSYSRLSKIPIEVEIDPCVENLTIEAETELHLLRIVQESLSNARKHSVSSKIRLSLRVEDGKLELSICDDGVGFNLDQIDKDDQHFGLYSMRDRAQAIGANIEIKSEPGSGTSIYLELPLKEKV